MNKSNSSPDSSPHPYKRKSMVDRNAYIKHLEEKLEQATSSALDVHCLSEQVDQLKEQLRSMEKQTGKREETLNQSVVETSKQGVVGAQVSSEMMELEMVKERLARLEEKMDKKRPGIRLPNPSIDEVWDRLEEVESSSCRLVEDCLGAVQSLSSKLDTLESRLAEKSEKEISAVASDLQERLTDGIEKIAMVLRKLVAVQKHASLSRSRSSEAPVVVDHRKRLVEELQEEIAFLERSGY